MARFLSIALLLFCTILTAQADIYSASNALSRGDFKTAIAEFTRLADKGDANAQANLGYMYYAGEGVPQDYEKAVFWYRKAAVQGNKDAQYNLAVSYAFGEGIKQDLTEAAIWYRRAGEQDHVVSQYSLGISYAYGEGVPQDQKEAARWFKKAADQGYARAQVNLGSMYHTGEGVDQDYVEAARWYRLAADRGDATAQYNLGAMYRLGKGLEQNYAQAKRWFRQSADQGYAAAQNELASLERSAAANVATRTIQTKPKLPSVKETSLEPEPTPTKKTEPIEKKVAIQKTEPEIPAQIISPEVKESKKKPLFSIEKEGLLSLDSSELDIPEPQTTVEPEIEEEVVETPAEITEETEVADVSEPASETSAINNALGIPDNTSAVDEESKSSGGFFSKLFSKKESSEPDTTLAETETTIETVDTNDSVAKIEVDDVQTPAEIPEKNETEKEVATDITDENPIVGTAGEINWDAGETEAPSEYESSESSSESSGGFFSKLFSTKESSEPDTTLAETETTIETVDTNDSVTKIEADDVQTPAEIPEKNKTEIEIATDIADENPIVGSAGEINWDAGETETPSEYESSESSGGFFSKLFSKKESSEPDTTLAETEANVETIQVIAETEEEIFTQIEQPVVAAPTEIVTTNEITEVSEPESNTSAIHNALGFPTPSENEESKSSASFFDKLFSTKESSEPDTTLAETETIIETVNSDEAVVETNEEEVSTAGKIAWDVEETIPEETAVADNDWSKSEADTSETDEESESSGGLFSAIGDFFSGGDKAKDTATSKTELETEVENENVLIAKVEETTPLTEEIELAQEAEIDLSQFSVQAGRRAITNNDYDEALKQFKPLAEAGDSEAQSHLGSLYYVGKGVSKNLNEAYTWYRKSADQGNTDAQYSMGNMYLLGEGIEQDNTLAAEWYTLASEQGHIAAKNNLASLKKLEELNHQNQLKLDAIATEEKTKKEIVPEAVEEPEEITALAEETTDGESETVIEEEKKPDLLDMLGGLFRSKTPDNESKQELELEPEINEVEVVELEIPETKTNAYAVVDTSSTEALQTLENEEIVADSQTASLSEIDTIVEETEQSNNIASLDDSTSDSPSFFKSLFGSNDVEKTNVANNVELESSEEIESINVDSIEPKEEITVETETEAIEETINESNNALAATTEEQVESEKSGGLFGFIGNIFSSEKENESSNIDNNESEVSEEIAMLETEIKQKTDNIDEAIAEEIIEENTVITEIERLRPLAIQGDLDAQYNLGALYYSGDSVKQDYSQAALWYRRAAQQGNADAQYSLGNMFLMGEGIAQDDNQAAHWYALAAEQGHSSAKHNLENIQKTQASSPQNEIETIDNGQLISLDDENTAESTSILDSSGKSEYEQGLAYTFGDGVAQNDRTAFNLFYEAAEKGYVLAQYKLGVAFAYGEGVRQDQKKAAEWYRKAAEQGYTIAQRNLATMYLDGKGVEQNKVQALAWYQVVAKTGNALDLRRRDMLKSELSDDQLSESAELSEQITNRLTHSSL